MTQNYWWKGWGKGWGKLLVAGGPPWGQLMWSSQAADIVVGAPMSVYLLASTAPPSLDWRRKWGGESWGRTLGGGAEVSTWFWVRGQHLASYLKYLRPALPSTKKAPGTAESPPQAYIMVQHLLHKGPLGFFCNLHFSSQVWDTRREGKGNKFIPCHLSCWSLQLEGHWLPGGRKHGTQAAKKWKTCCSAILSLSTGSSTGPHFSSNIDIFQLFYVLPRPSLKKK